MSRRAVLRTLTLVAIGLGKMGVPAFAQAPPLPPPPFPPENPITEAKRLLGKILFWDEQLSSDNSIACGTCHIPSSGGGADPRIGRNPGLDGVFNTPDDVLGSPGVAHMDASGAYVDDPVFGFEPQVTRRTAQPVIMAQYAPEQFWDGRARGPFIDPESGAVAIVTGAALEAQSIEPILSSVEMGNEGRTWSDVRAKLEAARPLAFASRIPPDAAGAIANGETYPQLFAAAFGDPEITALRIAFAISTYERTLVPNQTPWDRFNAGQQNALTPQQVQGLNTFVSLGSRCNVCHPAPQFTNQTFRNIGLRPLPEDLGRFEVTNAPLDRGRFKTPSLRNVGIRSRFMHNGQLATLEQVIDFYRNVNGQVQFPANQDPLIPQINVPPQAVPNLIDFLRNGLTDPRVVNEQFPFDRPRLYSELAPGDTNCDGVVSASDIAPFVAALTAPQDYSSVAPGCTIYSADLNGDGVVTPADIAPFVAALTGG